MTAAVSLVMSYLLPIYGSHCENVTTGSCSRWLNENAGGWKLILRNQFGSGGLGVDPL